MHVAELWCCTPIDRLLHLPARPYRPPATLALSRLSSVCCTPARWNFTPAPGWSKEEAEILKLLLLKHGVGRWIQILDTGLLPGKLIQQLNGQTQRLLGQQSLAAYTGLQVDVDRIRQDNEARDDVERKQGLVVHCGREQGHACCLATVCHAASCSLAVPGLPIRS